MSNESQIALIKQMLDSAEKSIVNARKLLAEMSGGEVASLDHSDLLQERLEGLSVSETDRVIEGVFDGENMVGADKRIYPIPANYASKSKLVEGDTLKLTIADDGSFIYKQIGPVERRKVIGRLFREDTGAYKVKVGDKVYRVLLASVTYFKAEIGDDITLVVPEEGDVEWGAVENVIKKSKSTPGSSSHADEDDEITSGEHDLGNLDSGVQELDFGSK
jgi:hypothetical protein